jgi:thioredoxin-like negative regulator of GroEL
MDPIVLRTILALIIALVGLGAYWVFNRVLLHRLRKPERGLEDVHKGVPAILYFTTPDCQPCKTQQRPTLRRLTEALSEAVQVIQIDATQRPDLADYWGVLSVPTTFIIDSKGKPRGVNHGVASAEKLHRQLEAAEGRPLNPKTASQPLHAPIADRK